MSDLKTCQPRAAIARAVAGQSPPEMAQLVAWRHSTLPVRFWWHKALIGSLALCATISAPAAWLFSDAKQIPGDLAPIVFVTVVVAVAGGLVAADMFMGIRKRRDQWRCEQRDLAWLSEVAFAIDLAVLGEALDHPHHQRFKAILRDRELTIMEAQEVVRWSKWDQAQRKILAEQANYQARVAELYRQGATEGVAG